MNNLFQKIGNNISSKAPMWTLINVACGVDFLDSVLLLLFDYITFGKCTLPERSSDEE